MRFPSRRLGWLAAALLAAFPVLQSGCSWLRRERPEEAGPLAAEEAVLRRREQGLIALIARSQRGSLVPPQDRQAMLIVDQSLVRSLLQALLPSEHVVAERYRVRVEQASVEFEDGLALVRLLGRASLVGAESQAFADVTVYGDLEVVRRTPSTDALRAMVRIVAVEVRRVESPVPVPRAGKLVRELSRVRLEEYAALASSIPIPMRQRYQFEIPAVAAGGPVRIAAAVVPVELAVLDVAAFRGKLWISLSATTGSGAAREPAPRPPVASESPQPPTPRASAEARIRALRAQHRQRHEQLEALLARDPLVTQASRVAGNLVVVVRSGFARDLIGEVAARYLDQVAVTLTDLEISREGVVERNTFLGRVRAGAWTAGITVHEVSGMLRAGAPDVEFVRGNRVVMRFPLRLEAGRGRATLAFNWDPKGLVNVLCRDFAATEPIGGVVLPEDYPVRGRFRLNAEPMRIEARPSFTRSYRLKFDLDATSWSAVKARLESQDTLARCGLLMNADKLLAELRALVARGFEVKLPERLFRAIRLPVPLEPSVAVEGRDVVFALADSDLRLTPEAVWYGARIEPALRSAGDAAARSPRGGRPRPLALNTPVAAALLQHPGMTHELESPAAR